MHIEHFDVNRIVTISVFGESPEYRFSWEEPRPIKRFFGLIDTDKFRPAGYYDNDPFGEILHTEEELRGYGYKVYSRDERIQHNVVNKAYAKVDLEHDNSLRVTFETEKEMLEWVDQIKSISGKTFETVIYK